MWLSDDTLDHLRAVADQPDLDGTRYRIDGVLGHGGMGRVYLAWDRELDRAVALKVLHGQDAGAARRMIDEARILARLEHPGIVPVHDAGVLPDGRVFCAMKRVRGQRLDELAAGDLGVPERLRIFQRICETVAFAHAAGILHRDLKPQNVMVGSFGEVLVLDWGIAGSLEPGGVTPGGPNRPAGSPSTSPGSRIGTPGWMAPEQETGRDNAISGRTDVFGLGRLLRYLLDTVPVPDRTRPPARLIAIADRAAAADPADRYPDVTSLAHDIDRFIDGLSVTAYREPFLERATRLAKKYRTPILLVLTYLVMRILFIVFGRP